ncbi:D-ribose pyranase [Oceanobacillus timonensis]|uniref:D-ribose pyranase n=1 Tax=Oceanobacillus timonensis TaxID=1926285 RepID=UPI0009B9E1B1|nr:D-ribose pyranase [Oceanobacillus timonensis]
MKKTGILNREIASVLARLGHTDTVIIADCGLPIPEETPCIDLSITLGTPDFESVLREIATDMVIEEITLAKEIEADNSTLHVHLTNEYSEIPFHYLSHKELKEKIKEAKAVIRTGEAAPYANAILQAGVIF